MLRAISGVVFLSLIAAVCCEYAAFSAHHVPPFFKVADFVMCGLTGNEYHVRRGLRPRIMTDCSRYLCVLQTNHLLHSDLSVDFAALDSMLEAYGRQNKSALAKVQQIQRHCLGELVGPPFICDADKLVHCIVVMNHVNAIGQQQDSIPENCRGPPPTTAKPHECCKIPPFFKEEDFKACGFEKRDGPPPPPPRGGPPPPPPDCSKEECMLQKYNLAKDDGSIDLVAMGTFLDKFGDENSAYKKVIDTAKERCVREDLPGPPEICDAHKIVHCVTSTLFMECPDWQGTPECVALKTHMDECRPYHRQPHH